MNKKYANKILNKSITDYNKMAHKFSSTRHFLSNDILELGKYIERGDKILDLGCGNGRLFELMSEKGVDYSGADVSEELINIAKAKYPEASFITLTDPIALPFKDKSFDKIFMLAVFHHIPSEGLRIKYLKEIKRVLKKNGELILTVWNLKERPEIKKRLAINKLLRIFGFSRLGSDDLLLNFNEGRKLLAKRFIHCFETNELQGLFEEVGFNVLEKYTLRRGKIGRFSNLLIVGKKID